MRWKCGAHRGRNDRMHVCDTCLVAYRAAQGLSAIWGGVGLGNGVFVWSRASWRHERKRMGLRGWWG